nr:xylulose kinase-1 [Tanacetum cinerariifolium]
MLVEKEYPLSRGALLMMLVQKLQVDEHNEMVEELLRNIFVQAERQENYLCMSCSSLSKIYCSRMKMTKDEAGNEIEVPLITAQQILARTRERKAKSTLLMAIPDEHLVRYHGIKDAKTLWVAIKTRFGDNLDIDDMYNNLKVYEADIKGSSGSSSNSQNLAFVSIESTSSTNELNAAYSVSTAIGHSSQA